jgi:REP element-mobilizing transposase RayT
MRQARMRAQHPPMNTNAPGSLALRRGRRSIPGHIYSITTATQGRRAWFADSDHAQRARLVLENASSWPVAVPLLWLLMPDHLHLLVEAGADETLSRSISRVKALIARQIPMDANARLWQPSFHDHALRRQETVLHIGRYILANPVRAGLVKQPRDWPWRGGRQLNALEEELPWQS